MKKSTLADALSVNQKLLDLAEKASGDEKKEIEKARETFCDLIVHLSGGIIQMGDAMDKQNDLIKKYQKALMIAASDLEGAVLEDAGCYYSCPIVDYCEPNDRDECPEKFLQHWLKEAEINEVKS